MHDVRPLGDEVHEREEARAVHVLRGVFAVVVEPHAHDRVVLPDSHPHDPQAAAPVALVRGVCHALVRGGVAGEPDAAHPDDDREERHHEGPAPLGDHHGGDDGHEGRDQPAARLGGPEPDHEHDARRGKQEPAEGVAHPGARVRRRERWRARCRPPGSWGRRGRRAGGRRRAGRSVSRGHLHAAHEPEQDREGHAGDERQRQRPDLRPGEVQRQEHQEHQRAGRPGLEGGERGCRDPRPRSSTWRTTRRGAPPAAAA